MRLDAKAERLFWKKVNKNGPDYMGIGCCWLWTAAKSSGYGLYSIPNRITGGKKRMECAHRLSFQMAYGEIPSGLTVNHNCETPLCVNPAHLRLMTPRENGAYSGNMGEMERMKTHCANGHAYDRANTYFTAKGHRDCRMCGKIQAAGYRARKRKERQCC